MKTAVLIFAALFAAADAANRTCGQTPIAPDLSLGADGKVVGGQDAKPYSWPWQMVWCSSGWFGCSLECGGSIVANGWAITAGHCVYGSTNKPGSFKVKVGVFNEGSSSESGEQVVEVQAIHLHPQYKPDPVPVWDIALIELKTQVAFSDHIQPVCLPSVDATVTDPPNKAWATGWGTTSEGGSISKNLKQVQVPFVNKTTCEGEYQHEINDQVMICAGAKGKDTCQGDSGGPLVIQSASGAWYMYGLTSWGEGCAEQGHPGVYSRVSTYCDWIAQTTGNKVTCSDPIAP